MARSCTAASEVDERASQQLAALSQVGEQLEEAGIDYWLFGGWAVDFYVNEVTRPHDDIDLAVWLDELPRIVELLQAHGWRHAPYEDEDGGTGYERDGVRLELTYLVRDDDGVSIPLHRGPAAWPDQAVAHDVRELHGTRSRLVSLAALAEEKDSQRDDPDDVAKDRADFSRLSRLLR